MSSYNFLLCIHTNTGNWIYCGCRYKRCIVTSNDWRFLFENSSNNDDWVIMSSTLARRRIKLMTVKLFSIGNSEVDHKSSSNTDDNDDVDNDNDDCDDDDNSNLSKGAALTNKAKCDGFDATNNMINQIKR
uniref:Uncharacterized protein n=1 Tax=Glossina austeni TaxID=7395 RepID=A0A1A9UPV0_GLOAU